MLIASPTTEKAAMLTSIVTSHVGIETNKFTKNRMPQSAAKHPMAIGNV